MKSIKDTPLYHEAIYVLTYSFGDFYLFDNFIVGEVHKDVVLTWKDHAKALVEEISSLYGQHGKNLVYLSNRVNTYSIVPSDWIRFFKSGYALRGYGIINYDQKEKLNGVLEEMFIRTKFKNFDTLQNAIGWIKKLNTVSENAA